MADYDYQGEYDNFDTQNFDTLGDPTGWNGGSGGGYSGFQTPQTNTNGGHDFNSEFNNFAGQDQYYQDPIGNQTWMNPQGGAVGTMAPGGNFMPTDTMTPMLGSAQNTLANIFNSKAGVSGLGALVEGIQNKKKASMTNQLAQRMQPTMDPFGSQRGFYQQQLQQATQDPYSSPIVRDQVAQLQAAQARKDAQVGRRSNSSTSDPAMLAASAQVAQNYINSLQTPAGANIGPQGLQSILQLQQSGINPSVNGMASPALSALGYNTGTATNSQAMSNMQLTPQQIQQLQQLMNQSKTGGR